MVLVLLRPPWVTVMIGNRLAGTSHTVAATSNDHALACGLSGIAHLTGALVNQALQLLRLRQGFHDQP